MKEDQIVSFFSWVDGNVQRMEYGTMTVTVMVAKGLPISKTATMVKQKRRRYKASEQTIDESANK